MSALGIFKRLAGPLGRAVPRLSGAAGRGLAALLVIAAAFGGAGPSFRTGPASAETPVSGPAPAAPQGKWAALAPLTPAGQELRAAMPDQGASGPGGTLNYAPQAPALPVLGILAVFGAAPVTVSRLVRIAGAPPTGPPAA